MKIFKAILLLLALGLSAHGQAVNVTANKIKGSATAPSGACSAQQVQLTTAGMVYVCASGTWTVASPGASALLDTLGSTRGQILYRGTSGWTVLSPDTSGKVLQTNGAGADPSWVTISGSGLGDVSGPASATDNAIARFDTTTGKTLQNSVVTVSDGGDITTSGVIKSGGGATASVDPLFLAARTINSGTGNAHSFSDSSTFARPVDGTAYNSFDARVTIGGTNNYDHYAAFQSAPVYSGSGTTTDHFGLYDAPSIGSGSTLNHRYGNYIANPSGAGTLPDNYGVYVEAQTKGATNYAIYTAGSTPSSFGGSVAVAGTLNLNSTGSNMRMRADGTTAKDAGIYVNSSGDIYFANWDATRGWNIASSGAISQLGSGAVVLNGTLQSGAFSASTVTASDLIAANATGGNIRFKGNATSATDGAILANSSGVLYFSNWDLNRGWTVTAAGVNKSLGGDIAAVASSAHGLVLKSPDGTCYRFTVANGGALSAGASITCP